ncbi:MAG: hypothetical protein WAQ98_02600 [Blastocatellia bacterium]
MTEKKYYGYQQIFEIDRKRKELEEQNKHKKNEEPHQESDAKFDQKTLLNEADLNTISDQLLNDQKELKSTSTKALNDLVSERLRHSGSVTTKLSREKTQLQDDLDATKLSREKTKTQDDLVGYYKIPNFVDDELLPTLSIIEQVIYRRLYRLSYGFNKQTTDSVGFTKLAEKCNLGTTAIKKAIKSLEDRGLIQVHSDNSRDPKGGNRYTVFTSLPSRQDATRLSREKTKSPSVYIKHDDDHDDLKRQDHHLTRNAQPTNLSEHEKTVMMMYQKITDNPWTKADSDTYTKVKAIPIEKIEIALRLASERAKNRPNSFAFFIKEILSVSSPKKQSRSQHKKAMEKIMLDIRNSKVGSSNYTISDFAYDVKEACIREDVTFDNNVFDEIFSKQKS